MEEDLDLDGKSYAWLLTIFYISYTLFEFQALMWKIVKPHQWAAFVVFSWYESHVQCCRLAEMANVYESMDYELTTDGKGFDGNVPDSGQQLARHDGAPVPDGRLRGWLRSRCALSAVILLPSP